MFEAFGDRTKRQRLHAGHCVVAALSVAHDAWQRRHFGNPPAVGLALDFDGKVHTAMYHRLNRMNKDRCVRPR